MTPLERPVPPATIYLGIDLGGTTISAAAASAEGRLLGGRTIPTESHLGPEGVLDRIAAMALELCGGAAPAALGLGVPGLVDLAQGRTLFLPNLPTQWRGVEAARILGARLGCPVRLLNDARQAALGELVFGAGREVRDMVFFTLGTGIGGGVVLDGKLRLGPLGAAGELGHQTLIPDGPPCGCGNRGCLETLASGPALSAEGVRLMRTGLAPKLYEMAGGDAGAVTPKLMGEAALAGDEAAREAIARIARWLAIGAANVATAVHPQLIVLGGGVAALGDLLLEPLRAELALRLRMFPAETVRVERSQLGGDAGLWGGVALAMGKGIDVAP